MNRNVNRLGMLLFIASEAIFFTLLILAYLYFNRPLGSIVAKEGLDPLQTGIFSAMLFLSSFTIWRATANRGSANTNRTRMWLALTILLGIGFLIGEGLEWRHLFGMGTTISASIFGTTFFTMTGFHGLHVTAGLLMLGIYFFLLQKGALAPSDRGGVDTLSLYWHFVDVVWVVIFSAVYVAGSLA
jgi:heme/copper-type cytochrome/quinol oxidase subunit 3